jgi:hypothetical protein
MLKRFGDYAIQSRNIVAAILVTTNPTAEWVARQLTEAFPWDERRVI